MFVSTEIEMGLETSENKPEERCSVASSQQGRNLPLGLPFSIPDGVADVCDPYSLYLPWNNWPYGPFDLSAGSKKHRIRRTERSRSRRAHSR